MKIPKSCSKELIMVVRVISIWLILSVAATSIATTYHPTDTIADATTLKIAANIQIQPKIIEFSPKPKAISVSPSSPPPPLPLSNLEIVMEYFTEKGLSSAAAAGISANLKAESSLNPARVQNKADTNSAYILKPGVGFGIAQWTIKERQKALVAFARNQGKQTTDLELQLEFMWQEMEANFPEMLARLESIENSDSSNISSPMEAAIVFHGSTEKIKNNPIIAKVNPSRGFEGSRDSASQIIKNRCKVAEEIYDDYEK